MKVVIDIECNALVNPTQIWLIVCKDIDTGEYHIFRNVTSNVSEADRFLKFASDVTQWIGHNILGYDYMVLERLLKINISDRALDTLVLSRLIDYPREKDPKTTGTTGPHSLEDYGNSFGFEKGDFHKWNDPDLYENGSSLYRELETYCIRDVDITHKVYLKYLKYILKEEHKSSIELEHKFQLITNDLSTNGFSFNRLKASKLLTEVNSVLQKLDLSILKEFPPKEVLIREFTPRATKHGTISRTSVPRSLHGDIHRFEVGVAYRHTHLVPFNPASHKQVVAVLNEAGWRPEERTKTYIDTENAINRLKYSREATKAFDLAKYSAKLKTLEIYGWKINEANLSTLPPSAPAPARTLAQRILYESRRRTLTEWLSLVQDDNRIHGKFYGIGAWTHRMAHQQPNTANIPNDKDTQGRTKLLGKELRSLWQAPKKRLLVGVDAEAIQLRIFAHYIDDKEFTDALVNGKKSDRTDPHSFNQRVLGDVCHSRQAAKRFIFALLLGGGVGKLAQILEASPDETRRALDRLMGRYQGFTYLKDHIIPIDAKRGWFRGIDGRSVRIPAETAGKRRHLCMSGYLQNGETVVMKAATVKFHPKLKQYDSLLVNLVHDEWQVETPNNMTIALQVAKLMADSLREVGEEYNLRCPLAGSYWSDDLNDYNINTTWAYTH